MSCYWFQQGRCAFKHFYAELVFDILARVPDARTGLLKCAAGGQCDNIPQEYIDFALRDETLVQDLIEQNEAFMSLVNKYTDRTEQANRQQPQLPVITPGDNT